MRMLVAVVALLALSIAGCDTQATGTCVAVTPDAGTGLACDVGWACDDDSTHYELACSTMAGSFSCTCYVEGTATKSFSVAPFTCDTGSALPAAASGCGWSIVTE